MKMSLEGFKKVSKDGNTTVLKHPAGHEMTVNHSILSPKMRGEIEALPSAEKDSAGNNHPDKKSAPMLADGGDVEDETPVKEVENSYNKFAGTMKPTPPPMTREEKYSAIRKRNSTNATGETSETDQPVYADGGDVEEVKGEEVPVSSSKLEREYAPEEEDAQKTVDADPDSQLESELPNKQDEPDNSVQTQSTQPPPADSGHGQQMLDAHNNAMEAHNTAMKLYAAGQQEASNQPGQQPASSQQASQPQPASMPSQQVPQSPQQNLDVAQQAASDLQQYHLENEKKNQELFNQVSQNKIDPNRLYANASTPAKITTAIGLILGGLGTSGTGGRNLAVDAMNKAIENDVDAQKANQAQGMNLYKTNLEATHSDEEARAMTINQQLTLAQAQLAQQAAKTNNMVAKQNMAKTNQEIIGLKQQNDINAYKAKTLQDLQTSPSGSGNASTGGVDLNKFNKLALSGVMPKEDVVAATKEAQNHQEAEGLRQDMESSAKHLDKQLGAGVLTPSDRQSAINAFAGRIAKVGEGRFNLEGSKLQAQALLPSPGDLPSTVKNKAARRQQFFNTLGSTPTLQRYGLVSKPQQTNPNEGKIASDSKGNKLIMKNGKWVPYNG